MDDSRLSTDSPPNRLACYDGWRHLALSLRVCTHQMNRLNSRNDSGHDDSIINMSGYYYNFLAHQHKATDVKLNKVRIMATIIVHSDDHMLRKETAFL